MIDEASRAQLGEAPYSREIFATLINGLTKMGARVIGIDFRFEDRKSIEADSLLCAAIQRANNVIIGCFFRFIFENTEHEDMHVRNSEISNNNSFLQSEEEAPVFADLVQTGVHIGHLNVLVNELTGKIDRIPFYVKFNESLRAAFSLEIIKTYYGVSDQEIKIANGKLVLMPGGRKPIRIPINENGEYFINYSGSENAFKNCYSLVEIYNYCKQIANKTVEDSIDTSFDNKIVIIGSFVDEDLFTIPFSVEFPGVLIHATVVDNILREQFITQYPFFYIIGLVLSGIILLFLFVHARPFIQLLGALSLFIGYCLISCLLFKYLKTIVPLSSPLIFMIFAATISGIYEYIIALQINASLNSRVQQLDRVVKLLNAKGDIVSSTTSYYRFIILPVEEREQCIFPHWLELRNLSQGHVAAFQPGLPVKNPLQVNLNTIRKLTFDLKKIREIYFKYIQAENTNSIIPLDQLKRIGELIVNYFGLKLTFNKLFNSYDKNIPLNLVMINFDIPWQLAYSVENGHFLCEEYAIGISFATEKEINSNRKLNHVQNIPKTSSDKLAILFYGDWQNHPDKQLKHVHKQVTHLEKKINQRGHSVQTIHEKRNAFFETLERVVSDGIDLRLIHYSGHAFEGYLDIGEDDFLKPGMISENLGLRIPSRPLVFLNACSSGKLPPIWDKIDNLSTEFLACGAAACIVTSFDVYEKTATIFSNKFYDYFIDQQQEAGQALKLAIRDLGQVDRKNNYDPEFDITRYAYCLYGDPTVKF